MKFSNWLLDKLIRLFSAFSPKDITVSELFEKAKVHNEKQVFKVPKDGAFIYKQETIFTIEGNYPCLRIKRKDSYPDRAVLYIGGGGLIMNFWNLQLTLAKKILKDIDCEVFYPDYPMATHVTVKEANAMIFETYRKMLDDYPPEKIAVIGLSAGATLALNLISWNNYFQEGLPMPALTVAISPGHIPAKTQEWEDLEKMRGIDAMVPVDTIPYYEAIYKQSGDFEDWMIYTAHGDFSHAGRILIYYGGKETLSFSAPYYEAAFKKASINY